MRVRSLLSVFVFLIAASGKPARREWATHDYYVLEHIPSSGIAIEESARALGAEIIERLDLPNHWLLRTPKLVDANHELRHVLRRSAADNARVGVAYLEKQTLRQRVKRHMPETEAGSAIRARNSSSVASTTGIADPDFSNQWHLVNDLNPSNSMNVSGLWALGITGEGVISAMVDDGLDYTSDDLAANFVNRLVPTNSCGT
jgi:kexin